MFELDLSGNTYRLGKLDVFAQLHVTRRIMPLVITSVNVMQVLRAFTESGDAELADVADIVRPLAVMLAEMEDERVDFILRTCLSVVHKQQGGEWHPLMTNGSLMFDDVDVMDLFYLTGRVIWSSLENFIQRLVTLLASQG